MNVRQLVARLAIAAPEEIVVIDAGLQSLFLLNQRSGMFQPMESLEECAGAKGWQNLNGACRAGITECLRQNRSARLFVAEPAVSLKQVWTENRNSN
jgi:hypothetical protein